MDNNHDKSTYEAQFAALMHALGARLGAEALEENAALQKDSSAAVPESVRRRCMEIIARHSAASGRAVRRVFLRIAVAALVALLLFATAFAVSPTLREKAITFFKEVFDTHTEFRMSEPTGADLANYEIEVGWLPEGMELVEDIQGFKNRTLLYQNHSEKVRISIYKMDRTSSSLDTESLENETVDLLSNSAHLFVKDSIFQLIYEDTPKSIIVKISGEQMSKSVFLQIIENLKFSQK